MKNVLVAIGNEELKYFSFRDNGLKCKNCKLQDKGAIELSDATVKAIKFIIKAEPKKIFSFDMADENKKQLKLLTKIYLDKCIEREYD